MKDKLIFVDVLDSPERLSVASTNFHMPFIIDNTQLSILLDRILSEHVRSFVERIYLRRLDAKNLLAI